MWLRWSQNSIKRLIVALHICWKDGATVNCGLPQYQLRTTALVASVISTWRKDQEKRTYTLPVHVPYIARPERIAATHSGQITGNIDKHNPQTEHTDNDSHDNLDNLKPLLIPVNLSGITTGSSADKNCKFSLQTIALRNCATVRMEEKSDIRSNLNASEKSSSDEQTEKKDLSDPHNPDDGDSNGSETDNSMKTESDRTINVSSSNLFEDNRENPIKCESTGEHVQYGDVSGGSETPRIERVENVIEAENLETEDHEIDPKENAQSGNLPVDRNKENTDMHISIPESSTFDDPPTKNETFESQNQNAIASDESSTVEESNDKTFADKNYNNTTPSPNTWDSSEWTKNAGGSAILQTNCPFSDIPLDDNEEMESAAGLPDENSNSADVTSLSKTTERARDDTNAEREPAGSIQMIFKERITSSAFSMQESRSDETGVMMNTSGATQEAGSCPRGDVIMVTGGSGFLGQHIVKMLQLRAPHVGEIRVLDLEPFRQKLEYEATKPVKTIIGSITDAECVASAVRGADSVIHVAGLVSWGTFPDFEGMKKVNVQGTLNVVNACLQENISRLIYCSTVDVVVGFEPIRGGDEDTTPIPSEFLFPAYPDTKYQGERLVLGASTYKKEDGGHLQTLALRVNVMYGELDPHYVINGLRDANKRKGILYQIGDGTAMFQQCYVGNAAWAFICADVAMKNNPQLTSLPFYVPDNTPVQNTFNFMRPYLEARGFQVSEGHLPYSLVYNGLRVTEVFARLLSRLTKITLPAQSCTVAYINMDIFFKREKAEKMLKYEPIFSAAEARLASIPYYKEVPL